MAMQDYLDEEIKKICPIDGISFGKLDNKATWQVHFRNEATFEQRQRAQSFIEDFVWTPELEKAQMKKRKVEEFKDNPLMKAQFIAYKKENPQAKFSDFIDYLDTVNVEE